MRIIIICLLLSLVSLASGEDEAMPFVQFCRKERASLVAACGGCSQDRMLEMLAVAGPEYLRYSWSRNLLETGALALLYLRSGTARADYSIGPFQMKPSFAEKLEAWAAQNPALTQGAFYDNPNDSQTAQRRNRIQRLNGVGGQLRYLSCFYDYMLHRYPVLARADPEARIGFLATAYNYGFDRPESDIRRWMSVRAYPYGLKYGQEHQRTYAGLALEIYRQLQRAGLQF